LPRQYHRRWGA